MLGDRRLMLENTNSTMAEQLRFKREFSDAIGFEVAIRQRIEELAPLHDPSVATVRRIEWLGTSDGLALVSHHVAGRRLSEMIGEAAGPAFAFEFIRQLAPALAAIQNQGGGIAHGVLTPERIIVTREGRLVIVEHVLGSAFELLALPAGRLREEFGLAIPQGDEPVSLDQRLDVIQLGFIALSLLAGHRLDPAQYPDEVPTLLETYARVESLASAQLRLWLEGALQLNRRPFDRPFDTAQDAHEAFEELSQELGPPAGASEAVVLPFHVPSESESVSDVESEMDLAAEPELDPASELETKPGEIDARAPPPQTVNWKDAATRTSASSLPRASGKRRPSCRCAGRRRKRFAIFRRIKSGWVWQVSRSWSSPESSTSSIRSRRERCPPVAAPVAKPRHRPYPSRRFPSRRSSARCRTPPGWRPRPASPTHWVRSRATSETAAAATAPASAEPAAPTGRFGGVRVTSPIELQVFEAGTLVGSTAGPIAVMDGPHTFDLVNEALGYRSRQTVTVKAGQMAALTVTVPNGRVSINALPWADVWIDGKPVGQTPIANLSLPIGSHEIVFRHPQFPDKRSTWLVKAEGITMVSEKFQQ